MEKNKDKIITEEYCNDFTIAIGERLMKKRIKGRMKVLRFKRDRAKITVQKSERIVTNKKFLI